MKDYFDSVIGNISRSQFLVLFWAAQAEGMGRTYNITNLFDDLKYCGLTRTKQNALASIESLRLASLINLTEEGIKKNIYITHYGAKALEQLVTTTVFKPLDSYYLRR